MPHFHVHLIPMFEYPEGKIVHHIELTEEEMDEIAEEIKETVTEISEEDFYKNSSYHVGHWDLDNFLEIKTSGYLGPKKREILEKPLSPLKKEN